MATTTRDQIIEKTCELIELQGYHATGLNQIIAESKTPKGSFYYHFPGGKEELATEAVNRVGAIVLKRIKDNLAQIDDPAESINAFILNIAVNIERSGFQAGGPITTIAIETASDNEALRESCDRIYNEWQDAFKDKLLSGGIAESRAHSIATLIITSIEGGVILCRTSRSREPMNRVAQEISSLVQQAV
jgi:TetR/AcrR family transcriptional regulator, lmrAB and yxaGH operons repressor